MINPLFGVVSTIFTHANASTVLIYAETMISIDGAHLSKAAKSLSTATSRRCLSFITALPVWLRRSPERAKMATLTSRQTIFAEAESLSSAVVDRTARKLASFGALLPVHSAR
jgi:hypothetical protein